MQAWPPSSDNLAEMRWIFVAVRLAGALGLVLSQAAIFSAWGDARAGTVANGLAGAPPQQ